MIREAMPHFGRATMQRNKSVILAAALFFTSIAGAAAHDAIRGFNGKPVFWKSPQVEYIIHPAGSSGIADDSESLAIRLAATQWNAALGGKLTLVEAKPPNAASDDVDDFATHRILFDETDSTGYFPEQTGIVALTPIRIAGDGKILDADVIFNGRDHNFSTDLTPLTYDVRDVAVHELGHFIGLDHSPFLCASMFPYVKHQQTAHRSLSDDDVAGAKRNYGVDAAALGRITGVAFRALPGGAPGKPLAGAHVSARRADGRTATGTFTKNDGSFELAALEPGSYAISIAPLDGPMTAGNLVSDFSPDVNFGSALAGAGGPPILYNVGAGTATSTGAILAAVDPSPSIESCVSSSPIQIPAGDAAAFEVWGSGISAGTQLSIPGGIQIQQFTPLGSGETGSAVAAAPSGAQTGAYDLLLFGPGGGVAVEAGAVEVVAPAPAIPGASPASGPLGGGQPFAIQGHNFSPGALVIFGDRLATGIVISQNQITGIVPSLAGAQPGLPVDVVVVNADGQETRKPNAYIPIPQLAAASVFPKAFSSAGGATAHIAGADFLPGAIVTLTPAQSAGPVVALQVTHLENQRIDCAIPALALGWYDITIANPAPFGASATIQSAFEIVNAPDPTIQQILPPAAPLAGGTTVRILGAGFAGGTKVVFGTDPVTGEGGLEAVSVFVLSPTELEAVAPPAASEGTVTLLVASASGQASAAAAFEYTSATAGASVSRGGGGGGPGCGAALAFEPPTPGDQAGAIASCALTLVLAAALARKQRLAAARAAA
jgi:hypothetical protein